PPRGAFERLRSDLIKHSAARPARRAFRMRWSRMSLRLTAAVAVVVIAIVLVAAYIAGQRPSVTSVPASSGASVAAYQAMIRTNHDAWVTTPFNCHTVTDSSCAADVAANRAVIVKWRNDLGSFRTPNQFGVIDAQIRKHLDALLPKFDVAADAVSNHNQALLDEALSYGNLETTWLDHAAQGISRSHQATSSQYTSLVQAWRA